MQSGGIAKRKKEKLRKGRNQDSLESKCDVCSKMQDLSMLKKQVSSTASIVIKRFILYCPHAVWVDAAELLDAMIARERPDFSPEMTLEYATAHMPLVVVDELGMEDDREHCRAAIRRFFKMRWERGKSTIITSALDKQELQARYGESMMARIRSCSETLVMTGVDWDQKG